MNIFIKSALVFSFMVQPVYATVIDGWDIQAESPKVSEILSIEQEVETYTGDMMLHKIEQTPSDGNVYIIIPITANRSDKNAGLLYSTKFQLQIGNLIFDRLSDDSFLVDYNIQPFTRLNIKMGSHKGSLIFEVPKIESQKENMLLYNGKAINKN